MRLAALLAPRPAPRRDGQTPRLAPRGFGWLLAWVAAVALFITGMFEPVENALMEARFSAADRAPTGEVTVVEIDARSLRELNDWPWPRRYHAAALDRLREGGVRTVAFDVDFSSRSTPAEDARFAAALKRSGGSTILPAFSQRVSALGREGNLLDSTPLAAFRANAWVGGVNVFPDADGYVRVYAPATWIAGAVRPAIATLLAEHDDAGDGAFNIDFSIAQQRLRSVSFADLLAGRVPREALAGKRVIIGATAIELGDRYAVPKHGILPGAVIQALAAESLLQQRAISRTGAAPTLALAFVIAALLGSAMRRPGLPLKVAAFAFLASVTVALPFAIQHIWPVALDTGPTLFVIAACALAAVVGEVRRQLAHRALHDSDTGLPNRAAMALALAAAPTASVAAFAVDRLADIASALGHDRTRMLIRLISERLQDLGHAQVFQLLPGTLAIPMAADRGVAGDAIDAALRAFRQPLSVDGERIDVALTAGAADRGDLSVGAAIDAALGAVDQARAAQRPVTWFESRAAAYAPLSLMSELRDAIEAGHLAVHYQPKVDLRRDRITKVEALVRWTHPERGFIPPDDFIPLAEETGVIRELTTHVLDTALHDCANWAARGLDIGVAVNVSAGCLADPEIEETVMAALARWGVAPGRLTLEITESAVLRTPEVAIAALNALNARGVRLSIDDYGTGQSTLSYLKTLPLHELKIDKSFVLELGRTASDAILVRSTIDLAHQLGLVVVAEGVDKPATIDQLRAFGCDYAQGYLISKAIPADDLAALAESYGSASLAQTA